MRPKDIHTDLTQKSLKEKIFYCPDTGVFIWLSGSRKGEKAGSFHKGTGYLQIRIGGYSYLAHRLAFLYVTGSWPKNEVDHRDTDEKNNRWDNLRDASRSQNCANRSVFKNNECGRKGVTQNKASGKWVARIRVNKELKHLGTFESIDDAESAYNEAAKKYHGKFSKEGSRINPREKQVLKLLAEGYNNPEIGSLLFISVKTVETHVYRLMKKTGLHNRVKLAVWFVRSESK